MNHDDLEFLVAQTLELAGRSGKSPFDEGEQIDSVTSSWPDSPGIIYLIDKASGTFRVRTSAVRSLRNEHEKLEMGQGQLWQLERKNELAYFPTSYGELAEVITDYFANRRFPIEEDTLCNLSDPRSSWYLALGSHSLKIYFQCPRTEGDLKLHKIGPIGDAHIASLRFKRAKELLVHLFPVTDFSCNEKCFSVSTVSFGNKNFGVFKDIFLEGLDPAPLYEILEGKIDRTFYLYFKELAGIRRFWLQIESDLKQLETVPGDF